MARRKNTTTRKPEKSSKAREPSFLLLGAVIVIVLLSGFIVKLVVFPNNDNTITARTHTTASQVDESVEGLVQLVALEFRCACGGCGEMPLIECSCDMPRGAIEQKNYIREKLKKGLPPQQVIEMVDELFGHRMKG